MTHRRVRHACVAALALLATAVVPATAGAHPLDCAANTLTAGPTEWFAHWTGDNDVCKSATGVRALNESGARSAAAPTPPSTARPADPPRAGKRGVLKQVGHEPLMNRGMNAALTVHEDYAYVGSRTDGGHAGQPHGGILAVDISDPSDPDVVNKQPIDANPGESSRELRVWKSQDVLIVLNTNCGVGPTLHHCTRPSVSNLRFYDISGENAAAPKRISQFNVDTHEFFLWEDPDNPQRALIFAGNASGGDCRTRGGAKSCPFTVWDISNVRRGEQPKELYGGHHKYDAVTGRPRGGLHSLTISNDGSRGYYALLTGGFAVVDTSEFAEGADNPEARPITINEDRPTWDGPGAHSVAKLWNRDWAWVSDEVYGSATSPDHGCPWGWTRMIDLEKPKTPQISGEYRVPENDPRTCDKHDPPRTSYSSHNPTLTPTVAFSTWHSGGVQAVSLENPRRPYQLAEFKPEPLDDVMLEDPRLYVLKYRGAFHQEVRRIDFLDGNSNHGDCFEPVGRAPRHCRCAADERGGRNTPARRSPTAPCRRAVSSGGCDFSDVVERP